MIKTPQTHPDHQVVGGFYAHGLVSGAIFYCDSYDTDCGYWMTNIEQPEDRRNVSERAIGRTLHRIYHDDLDRPDGGYVSCGLGGWTGRAVFLRLLKEGKLPGLTAEVSV